MTGEALILIPTHRRPGLLAEAIASGLRQDYAGPVRVVVVSDADPSARPVAEAAGVEYIELPEHGDLSGCMNRGFQEMTPETRYVMMLQDDDQAQPWKLRVLAEALDRDQRLGAVCSLSETIDAASNTHPVNAARLAKYLAWGHGGITRETMVERNRIDQPTVLWRAAAVRQIGGFNPALHRSEETDYHMRMLDAGWRIGFRPIVTARYRLWDDGKTLSDPAGMGAEGAAVRARFRARWFGASSNVVVCLATVRERRRALVDVLASLCPQCDDVRVYVHGYQKPHKGLQRFPVTLAWGWEHGDRAAADKFWWAPGLPDNAYLLTCDDDLVYPADYVRRMVDAVEFYGRRRVVAAHGVNWHPRPIRNYHRDRFIFHFNRHVCADVPVHVPGTGCMAYHTSLWTVTPDDLPWRRGVDLGVALKAQREGIGCTVIGHDAGWIRLAPHADQGRSIFAEGSRTGAPDLAEAVNAWPAWRWPA
jgi:hypothetical protein